VTIGQTEQIGRPKFGIASATGLGDLYELERDQFPDSWSNPHPMNSVVLEIVIGDGESAIVSPAMVRELDLDAIEHTSGG
jgi:hypothetical protein